MFGVKIMPKVWAESNNIKNANIFCYALPKVYSHFNAEVAPIFSGFMDQSWASDCKLPGRAVGCTTVENHVIVALWLNTAILI